MANARNQEKPSPILMLAPVAFVLLGYYYVFFMDANSELTTRREQQSGLVEKTRNIDQEQLTVRNQLAAARKELADAKEQTAAAASELADAEAEKAKLRSGLIGRSQDSAFGVTAIDETTDGDAITALAGQFASMFTSTVSPQPGEAVSMEKLASRGVCHQMNSICSILDSHQLQRLENAEQPTATANGLVAWERDRLGNLLDTKLPPMLGFEIQLEGSFPNLIAALRELNQRLPSLSILSVSLNRGEVSSRRRVWNLQIGIQG